jgi:hypothetical protein
LINASITTNKSVQEVITHTAVRQVGAGSAAIILKANAQALKITVTPPSQMMKKRVSIIIVRV